MAWTAAPPTSGAASGWLAAHPEAISMTIGLVIVVALVLSKMRDHELQPRRRILLPVIVIVAGLAVIAPQIAGSPAPHAVDLLVGATDLVLSIGLGVLRGLTVRLHRARGTWWYRYRIGTVALWALSILARAALGIYAAHHGAIPLIAGGSVLFLLGLSLISQNLTVLARAAATSPDRAAQRVGPAPGRHGSVTSPSKGRSS